MLERCMEEALCTLCGVGAMPASAPAVWAGRILLQPAHEAVATEDVAAGHEGVRADQHVPTNHAFKIILQLAEHASRRRPSPSSP